MTPPPGRRTSQSRAAGRTGRSAGTLVVAVALLAVLAGCSVFSVADGEPTPPETVTPAPVPTADAATAGPTVAPADDPGSFPAVSANGDVNASGLFESHVDYLSSRSYTVEWERRASGGSGPLTREYRRRVAVDDGTYLRRDELAGSDNVTITYSGPGGAYRRVVGAGADGISRVDLRNGDPPRRQFAEAVSFEVLAFLSAGHDEVDVVRRDGRRYARIFTDHAPRQITETYAEYAVHNFTATLWVAPAGYVRAVHYDFDLVDVDERIAVEWRYAYSDVGETTVERPSWVPRNGSATASATAVSTSATTTATPDSARVPPPTDATAGPPANRSAATATGHGG